MRSSLRVKITMLFLVITSISLSLVGVCNYQTAKASILQSLKDNAQAKVQMQSQALSTWITTRLAEVKIMSHTDLIRFGDDAARLEYLKRELDRSEGNYFSFGISDRQGRLRDVSGTVFDISEDPSFNNARKGYDVVSDPYPSALANDKPVIAIQVPLYNREQKNEEILYASFLADQVFNRVTEHTLDEDKASALLVLRDGTIIFDSDRGNAAISNIKDTNSPFQDIGPYYNQQPYGLTETQLNDEPYLLCYSEVQGTSWYMAVLTPMESFEDELHQLFWTTVLTVSLTEMTLGFIMFFILNGIARRIRLILNVTESVAGGNLKVQPVSFTSSDEIGALAQSVNGMVDNLRTTFERLNAIINQNDYAIIVVNTESQVTYFNRTAEAILGYTAEEVIHKETMFLWHDEQEIFRRAERLSAELGIRVPPDMSVFLMQPVRDLPENYQWTFIHKDGSRFPVNLNVTPMRDHNGIVTGYVALAHDIRIYKHAEETRNRLLSILDAAKDLIASVDDRGYIFYMNPAGMELLEIDEWNEETQNTKQYFNKQELDGFIGGLHHLYKNGYWEHETVVRTRGGIHIPMSIILVAHKDKQGKVYYSVIARDIQEQKRIQEELVQAKQAADQANEAKSRFLARMSHEIRTPLNGIIGFSQLLMRTELNDIQREYGPKIVASSQTLLRIVNDILDFSKVEAGKIQLERIPFSLNETVSHLCDMISVLLGKEAVEVFIDTPEQMPSAVLGDPLRLEQVLLNLCNNALRFTKQGCILVKLEMLQQHANEVLIEFTVEDSGIGMDEGQLNRLFEPFRQADDSTSRKYGGTGLGLVISKNLIELMGGTIRVQSKLGTGTRFSFQLPLELASTARIEKLKLPPSAMPYRVLLVQQSSVIANKLRNMLESFSLEVTAAASWSEGYLLLQNSASSPYHLALLDMEAEDMYGIDTWLQYHELMKSLGSVSIAMTTAYGREEVAAMPEEQRPDWVMVKPVNRHNLYQMLHTALERLNPPAGRPQEKTARLPLETINVRGRILLAEDNEMNQRVAVEMLKSCGCNAVVAANGIELLERLEQSPTGWDLILMDIQMPEMDGYEATRLIRSDSRFNKLPIVALTANVLPEEREACFTAGMNAMLHKPLDRNELAAILHKWVPDKERLHNEALAALPELSGIDVTRLLDQLNGKVPIMLHLLNKFHQEYKDFTMDLRELVIQGDWDNVRRKLHSLKGVAANLAADRLLAAASSLESTLKEELNDDLEQKLLAIKQEVDAIVLSLGQAKLLQPEQEVNTFAEGGR